jgi:GTPase SAR1 family protein
MNLGNFFSGFRYDIRSAVITIVVAPVVGYLLIILAKYLKFWSKYAIEGVLYWVSRTLKRSIAAAFTLKRYCDLRLAEENKFLYVPSGLDIKLNIDKVFVPLTLEGQGTEKATYTHETLLTVGNRIRVIGDPGSGKSSLVKRILRDACLQAIRNPQRSKLPILVELKSLNAPAKMSKDKLGTWFFNRLRSDATKSDVYQMADCFETYAKDSGLLVLLDGLDEVSSLHYSQVEKALISLSEQLDKMSGNNTIVLTMRTQFHQQVRENYRTSFGPVLQLKSFTPSDIYDFLTRWPFAQKGTEHMARIYKELTDRPTLREMCSNPLILSMYVAEDQTSDNLVAPDSRTEFYKKVTEELIIKRRLQQTGHTAAYTKLREQRERILGRLAFDHMLDPKQPANSLEWNAAIHVAQSVMKCSEEQAGVIVRELSKETGLIGEERPEQSLRFIHLTFCEFMAAFEAVQGEEDGWSKLIKTHRSFQDNPEPQLGSRLAEVIPFASGLLPRVKRQAAITEVADLRDNALLARSFLETKLYDHSSWSDFVLNEKEALLSTPEISWDKGWLDRLHLFQVVIRDAADCAVHLPQSATPLDISAFFQSLVRQQRESLSKLLSTYAAHDAAAAFRLAELSNLDLAENFPEIIVKHCDQAPFFALVCEQAVRDKTRIGRWASLLAESGLQSSVVADWLSQKSEEPKWIPTVEAIPWKKRWFQGRNRSFYTQCLTVAANETDQPPKRLLDTFRKIPAAGNCRSLRFHAGSGIAVSFIALIVSRIFLTPIHMIILTLLVLILVYPPMLAYYLELYRYSDVLYGPGTRNSAHSSFLKSFVSPRVFSLLLVSSLTLSGRRRLALTLLTTTDRFFTERGDPLTPASEFEQFVACHSD